MSRLWITAQSSVSPVVARWHREDLRRHYRRLRKAGFNRRHARAVIEDITRVARIEVKP